MRSLFAARSARLALVALASVALAATATANAAADSRSTTVRACKTNDLTFKVSSKTQAGGYYLVTAKAKSGVTCHLKGVFPSASFGYTPDTAVSAAEHAVSEDVLLSGSTAAYAGINPKTTDNDYGKQFELLHLSIAGDEANTITLDLPDTATVDRPIATNWHADPADAVPFSG
ncbi:MULTISPECIES: DUF4232 domain-containing protein [Streptomyces]|uniref:DUF4232 domain-containing protein n=1 Tax=Streptomyces chartreusis NRRL 3882 TaxID=1079985 RepID=A0A2N9B079_STRCX|nr:MULTISPECIES: DUF4232 domain-containing protein [Streptomyces]MYS92417.1 DUF4232 domain-containing protein [Streptomyces sp. SID5464]SOR76732.1 hypothetical protein SCNRRL3882_0214 [Streptomyces chartreusis NRRL 3882]